MSRALWFAAGAGASMYAMRKLKRAREAFTADGLRDRAGALALGARLAREEVAQGRVEKAAELRERLGLAPVPTTPQLEPGRHRDVVVSTGSTHRSASSATGATTEPHQEGSN